MVGILECRTLVKLLVLCHLIFLVTVSKVEARIRHYRWELKYEYKSPDCFKKLVITINGGTPGPKILAQQGDTVVVELKNSLLTENVAIHWHGIRQIGTPWSDGTEGVTQCPILPGDTFIYKFVVDRAGSYLYHAHYGIQREAGLYGSIIVSVPNGVSEPFAYDYDRSIILNDWYHKSTYEQATGLSSIPFVWVGEPQSLLINGRGRFNCSLLEIPSLEVGVCNAKNPDCSPYILTVIPGKTYRLRIGSLTSLSALSFQIEGHNMTVVEADGHYVEPFETQNLYIYSGETYSVLVSRKPATPTALAILNYYSNYPKKSPPTLPTAGPLWNETAQRLAQSLSLKAHKNFTHTPPLTSDKVIVLLNTQNKIDGVYRWSLNNVSFSLPHTPYLVALKENVNLNRVFDQNPPPENYDFENYDIYSVAKNLNATSSNGIYRLWFNSTVDVILQNANTMTVNNSETHPWHLHGHDFWVLGYGTGKFDIKKDVGKYNLVNPIMKNTVPVHPYGWTALRFRADNPGVWAFHCHIESHFYMGMGVVFEEGVENVGKLPSSVMGCGETKGFHTP
ncbi:L-ascorbate oxidase-like [Pyrus ussuriensis x Pyrus communis]|uniref:L-ascorbate oxidase n=1 Tax=Pyrus ussuriensis x Pyrus communis TaxID=2448454 RepID=A0A5N5IE88_9ROSA|nr:L-ascorbate oxidase-like [Pyrus ussuriensis x Pyrus communis]